MEALDLIVLIAAGWLAILALALTVLMAASRADESLDPTRRAGRRLSA